MGIYRGFEQNVTDVSGNNTDQQWNGWVRAWPCPSCIWAVARH